MYVYKILVRNFCLREIAGMRLRQCMNRQSKQHLYFHISSPRIISSLFSRKIRIRMIRNIAKKEGENSFNIRYVYLPFIDIRFQWYRFAYNILLTYVLTFFGSIRYANYNPIVYRISIYRQVLSQYIKFHDTIL